MIDSALRVPEDVDITVPSSTRMYDYMLGGSHNFAVDRELVDELLKQMPTIVHAALRNRAFLRRAVLTLVEAGVRQFLDIGSGMPTAGNVHEIVQRAVPDARVVYVDIDPVAVAHSELILADNDRASAILADIRSPTSILGHPKTRELLDFDAPIGLLMVTILHFVADSEDPLELMARYRDPLAAGSHLVISHATTDINPAETAAAIELYKETTTPIYARTHAEIAELFTGFELIDPGLVSITEWQPHRGDGGEGDSKNDPVFAGIGIKR